MIEIDKSIMEAYSREREKLMALREAIIMCNIRAGRESPYPNIGEMLAELQKRHGKRRVAMFFANVINGSYSDGRYSRQTQESACNQPSIPQHPSSVNYPHMRRDPPSDYYTNMHPTLVNMFAEHIIRSEREARANRKSNPSR